MSSILFKFLMKLNCFIILKFDLLLLYRFQIRVKAELRFKENQLHKCHENNLCAKKHQISKTIEKRIDIRKE